MALKLGLKSANVYKTTFGLLTYGCTVQILGSGGYNLNFHNAVPARDFRLVFQQLLLW